MIEKVETPAGIFTINTNVIPTEYSCTQKQMIESIHVGQVRIITMDQAVTLHEHTYSPRIYQSCMNPDKIMVYPLIIEWTGEKIVFRDQYGETEWHVGEEAPQISNWDAHIRKMTCNPCRNCGGC